MQEVDISVLAKKSENTSSVAGQKIDYWYKCEVDRCEGGSL